jgi:hypothetical protein
MGHGRVHWTANFDEIQDFEHDIRGPFGGTGFMTDEAFASGTRGTPLGDPKSGISPELDALAAYVASLSEIPRSPFRGAGGALTPEGEAGQQLFVRLRCDSCHGGPHFSDSASGALHDVGTLLTSSGARLGAPLTGLDTPTLRGVWATASYLHDGSAPTLLDVLTTRNPQGRHGDVSALSSTERSQLVAYLLQIE